MDFKEFIENFADLFDDIHPSELNSDTEFKKMDEWSSLMALSVIAMIDEEYNVHIGAKEILDSQTIGDLFNIIKN